MSGYEFEFEYKIGEELKRIKMQAWHKTCAAKAAKVEVAGLGGDASSLTWVRTKHKLYVPYLNKPVKKAVVVVSNV